MSPQTDVARDDYTPLTAKSVNALSDEELRVKVAELCGWTELERQFKDRPPGQSPLLGVMPEPSLFGGKARIFVPNYPADLNAMHEAEKYAAENLMNADQWEEYGRNLERSHPSACLKVAGEDRVDFYDFATLMGLTARQRAEAFVLTLEAFKGAK